MTPAPPKAREARCDCGSLLARLTARGVELKCRRCKRIIVIPLDAAETPPRRGGATEA